MVQARAYIENIRHDNEMILAMRMAQYAILR